MISSTNVLAYITSPSCKLSISLTRAMLIGYLSTFIASVLVDKNPSENL
jgi:hypothetical protein